MKDKQKHTFQSTFERLIIFRQIPYWIYWSLVGVFIFVIFEVILLIFNDNSYYISRILISTEIAILPIIYIWLSHAFKKTMTSLASIFWDNDSKFDAWLSAKLNSIFTLKTAIAKVFVIGMTIGYMITIFFMGFPYTSILNNGFLLVVLIFAIIGSQGAHIIISLLRSLREVSALPVKKISFFLLPHPKITALNNLYVVIIFFATLTYSIFLLAAFQGPYGLPSGLLLWLYIGGFFPLLLFIWSFIEFRILAKKIKTYNITQINIIIQKIYKRQRKSLSQKDTEILSKMMEIQKQIQEAKETNISLEGFFTFLLTLILPIAQLLDSIFKVISSH